MDFLKASEAATPEELDKRNIENAFDGVSYILWMKIPKTEDELEYAFYRLMMCLYRIGIFIPNTTKPFVDWIVKTIRRE
jgi:hypothetical protein